MQTDKAAPKTGVSLGALKLRSRWGRCGSSIGLVGGGHVGLVGGRTEVGDRLVGLGRHGWTNRTDPAGERRSFAPSSFRIGQRFVLVRTEVCPSKEKDDVSREVAAAWAISPIEVMDSAIPGPCLRYGVSSCAVASFGHPYSCIAARRAIRTPNHNQGGIK